MTNLDREIAGKFFEGSTVEELSDFYQIEDYEIEQIIRDCSEIKEPKE